MEHLHPCGMQRLFIFKDAEMKTGRILIALVAMGSFLLTIPALAGDIYVITNNATALASDEIREIFIGDKQIVGGVKVVPIENAALQKEFLEKVIKMDGAKYSNVWTKKGFREGLNPPAMKSGDAEVTAVVKSMPGAIGYVSSLPSGVKLIQKY
jgi:ABC-type phosphate transport system substrate-binding protein